MVDKVPVSVVVRTFNEEKWIRHCISSIRSQSYVETEIILVDSGSTDRTVDIAKLVGIDKLVLIDNYTPGLSLNSGIKESSHEFVAIISAHCIPHDDNWLYFLINALTDVNIVGVYSRQIPMPYTLASDALDLFITFGTESRVQYSDSFFHNASSLIRRSIWSIYPFDEQLTNIEDRIWADTVISNGYAVAYSSKSIVFHHHGIHQSSEQTSRSLSTASIVKSKYYPYGSILPECLSPSNINILTIISCRGVPMNVLSSTYLSQYNRIDLPCHVYVIHDDNFSDDLFNFSQTLIKVLSPKDQSLSEAISSILTNYESSSILDYVFYLNCDYVYPRPEKLSQYLNIALDTGYDIISSSFAEHATILLSKNDTSEIINSSLDFSGNKLTYQKITLGQGVLTHASCARSGNLLDKKNRVHIINSPNILSTIRHSQTC